MTESGKQQKQIKEINARLSKQADTLAEIRADLKFFKEAVARDIKQALELIENK